MGYIFVGLGNPGEEYEGTRHNAGRMALDFVRQKNGLPDWKADKKINALVSKGIFGGKAAVFLAPETFMNNSGNAVKKLIKTKKDAEKLVVIHDDLDLPIGSMKISFAKNSGGHKGVESIISAVKTNEFVRIRIGICPVTPSGKIKKPKGEDAVIRFILGKFSDSEMSALKKVFAKINDADVWRV